ncbi:hypothetical protein QBC35DRAFT_217288 [Podospora australis]|uniref:Uncharacterized protein n=1 Tax=Podospora australis TaxID=1536484 RepID=A0AAN6WTM5_9PEZI|nr:hypothetical protein QBC35DRAFT_217288 [Podospora australis]
MERGRAGGRGGRGAKKRATLPSHQHHQQQPAHFSSDAITPTPTTPVSSSSVGPHHRIPHTAPHRGTKARIINPTPHRSSSPTAAAAIATADGFRHQGHHGLTPRSDRDRPARSNTYHSSSFPFEHQPDQTSTYNMPENLSARKRAKTFETPSSFDGAVGDEAQANSKGGHSLRRRARIDYTQMIDDGIGLAVAGAGGDATAKSAVANARSRKRKNGQVGDTDDDTEAIGSSSKRRRAGEKSPVRNRAASRRRQPAKKSVTGVDVSAYLDHQSDNEVQDTIMVGVSMDALVTDDESEESSFQESQEEDSPPSSPEGVNSFRPEAQPPTPQTEPTPATEQPVSIIETENNEPMDRDILSQATEEKVSRMASAEMEVVEDAPETVDKRKTPPPAQHFEQAVVASPAPMDVDQPNGDEPTSPKSAAVEESEATIPKEMEKAVAEKSEKTLGFDTIHKAQKDASKREPDSTSPEKQQLSLDLAVNSKSNDPLDTSSDETQHPSSDPSLLHGNNGNKQPTSPPTLTPTLVPAAVPTMELATSSSSLPTPSTETSTSPVAVKVAVRPLLRQPKPTGPTRLPQLEKIYAAETPFASALGLTPYEQEDVVLPGPYTEWVYPADDSLSTPVPTPTPTPTPTMIADRSLEVSWDVTKPLRPAQLFALHKQESKRREEKGLPSITLTDFWNECVRRHKAAMATADEPSSETAVAEKPNPASSAATVENVDETPVPESQVPTAAPSPVPFEEDAQLDDEQQDQEDPQVPSRPARSTPVEPIEVTRNYANQYLFPKIRDPADLIAMLENPENLDSETLYRHCAAAAETLRAYELEYHELRKITDDEENAKRRQANDKTIVNWENRQKADEPLPFRRTFDEPVKGPPPFEVRGARAAKPYIDDLVLEHQREEDKIMAQAYGFKHNNHPTQVGRQNPQEQRWEMPETRLRERKRTEKGAELAEENVVEGKRTRKPRNLSDQSKEPSRSATPALTTGRRQRKPTATAMNGDGAETSKPVAAHVPEPAQPAESPRKQRAAAAAARARQHQMLAESEVSTPAVSEQDGHQTEEEERVEATTNSKQPRKRARATAAEPSSSAPTTAPTEVTKPAVKGKRAPKIQPLAAEIASSSFYGNPTVPESRPSTASSEDTNHTADTVESTYSLREKRKRNFALENDPELEARAQKRRTAPKPQPAEPVQPKKAPAKKKNNNKSAANASRSGPTSAPAVAPEPAPEPPRAPEPEPEHVLPPPPMIAPQPHLHPQIITHQQPPPPPPPSGGLKAPNFFYTNPAPPVLAPAPAPPPPPQGPFMHTFAATPGFQSSFPPPPAAPPMVKKVIQRIKLTNNHNPSQKGSSSKSAAKASRAGSQPKGSSLNSEGKLPTLTELAAEAPEKTYAEMSKSEKMSYSMRRRWASGEMQGAVEKRRNTLANKKAEKAGTSGENSQPGSGASTPQPQMPPTQPPPHPQQQPQVMMMLQQQPPQPLMPSHPGPLALPGVPQVGGLMQPLPMQQPHGWGPQGTAPQMVPGGPGGQMVFSFPVVPPPPHPHHMQNGHLHGHGHHHQGHM